MCADGRDLLDSSWSWGCARTDAVVWACGGRTSSTAWAWGVDRSAEGLEVEAIVAREDVEANIVQVRECASSSLGEGSGMARLRKSKYR